MSHSQNVEASYPLEINQLSHHFVLENGEELRLFQFLNFVVNKGEIVAVVGRSGAGKSPLFNLISGLLKPSSGRVILGNAKNGAPGRIAYMLQKDLLLPWRTILDNALLGVEMYRKTTEEDRQRAINMLARYGLSSVENAYPSALSGGMKQRVALTRTLLCDPTVILLDEPFSALDYETRLMLEDDVMNLTKTADASVILVTHDIDEAIAMSNRVVLLGGRPAKIVMNQTISLTTQGERTAVSARGAPEFHDYHTQIWNGLRMNNVTHGK